ncbi:MAG: 1-phosphofructokinase family hexose kinase [Clostridiales bacterium]|nr:1-phosphofructokinase family hexose kinase [Clostridiales bacterium]
MITTVCLNPAIDQSAEVDRLRPGEVNRLCNLRSEVGGKGVNVAIVLGRLQADVRCVYCTGETDAPFFAQGMEGEGIRFHAVSVPGSVRHNLKVIETDSRLVTELNQQGAQIDAQALKQLEDLLRAHTETGACTALCGSLPPGCGQDTYQTIMQGLLNRQWVVDTSGEAMRCALSVKPFLIKPNRTELEEIVGNKLADSDAVKNAAVSLCKSGVKYIVVSLGEQGALATDGDKTVFAYAVPVTGNFAVGAGDAMLAGLLYGISRGETPFDSLRYGAAAGAACVEGGSIHAFKKRRFEELLLKTETREL